MNLSYEDDPEKVSFYTGLPNIDVLKLVFKLIEGHMGSNIVNAYLKKKSIFFCVWLNLG